MQFSMADHILLCDFSHLDVKNSLLNLEMSQTPPPKSTQG